MSRLEKLYNKTSLEKEIKEFYQKVEEDTAGYVSSTLSDKVNINNLIIDAKTIKIETGGHEPVTELDRALYKIPGKVIMDQNSTMIMM